MMAYIAEDQLDDLKEELTKLDEITWKNTEHVQTCLDILEELESTSKIERSTIVAQENSIIWGPDGDDGWYLSVRDETTGQSVRIQCPDNKRIAEMEAEFKDD